MITELAVLRWLHILAMVYWLGGEWGVFQTSTHVINRKLSMEERRRHMETAYKIDILARTGIILLLPLGLHMGHIWGVQPLGGMWLWLMWALFAGWLALCWAAFIHRETDTGIRLTIWDERIRYLVIPALVISAGLSLLGYGPFEAGTGQKWFSWKVLIYGLLLVIGLQLRYIMREWTELFRVLAAGPNPEAESKLEKSLRFGKRLAYVYWIGIASVAFFGATKFV
ncbi:MAG: hypothetical protein OXE80_06040 [Gammaproteobacteria bacterium]|nr:hypothetical protein [Gammaproteobacteria bacterium]MCY4181695.1 hypothetical protein [Gammaproteobacteria bacterium]MCY4269716.1 hypothetical protein [Gammaproteobacteria bacterium]MCY4296916.1 hypothetical protein [Gammaproteobacteria bacterium]